MKMDRGVLILAMMVVNVTWTESFHKLSFMKVRLNSLLKRMAATLRLECAPLYIRFLLVCEEIDA